LIIMSRAHALSSADPDVGEPTAIRVSSLRSSSSVHHLADAGSARSPTISAEVRAFCLIFRISRRAAGQRHGPAGSCVFLCSGDLWPRSTRPPGRRRGPGSPSCPAAGRPSGERRAAGELMQGGIIEQRREPGRMRHGQGLQIEPPGRPAALQVHHPPTIAAGQRLTRRPGRRHDRTCAWLYSCT
jgi:hypothetical protein